jgi:biotin synthase-like enzyme
MGNKMYILNKKKNYCMCSKNFELLSQIKGNSIHNSDFLKLIICVMSGHCGYCPQAPENLAMPSGVI